MICLNCATSTSFTRNEVGITSMQSTFSRKTFWFSNRISNCSQERSLFQYSTCATAGTSWSVSVSLATVPVLTGSVR